MNALKTSDTYPLSILSLKTSIICILILFLGALSSCHVSNFTQSKDLIDLKGASTALNFYIKKDKKVSPFALIYLAAECPISQKYAPILRGLQNQFRDIKFLAIFTKWDRMETINEYLKEYPLSISGTTIPIPVLIDKKHKLLKKIDARITPEVFLFDKNSVLIYRGAIDNWFFALGQYRAEATEHYLADALQSLLNNEPVKIKQTNAIGCIIEK